MTVEKPVRYDYGDAGDARRGDELNNYFFRHYECEKHDGECDKQPRGLRDWHIIGHNWFSQNGLHNTPQTSDTPCNATAVPDGDTR